LNGPVHDRLVAIIHEVAGEHHWQIIRLAVQPDQVPLFLRANPSTLPTDIPRLMQGRSSHDLREEFPHLRRMPWLWTRSSFISTAGNVSQETMQRSIEAHSRQEHNLGSLVSERLRKASPYTLKPTPDQERQLEQTVWRCRLLSNTALEQRKSAYERCGVTLSASQQQAELPDLTAAFPASAAMHSPVLQEVLTRLDHAFQAFFRRLKGGEKPGYPRFQGRPAPTPSPTSSMAMVPGWTTACWSCPSLAMWPCGGVVHWRGPPRRSRAPRKPMAGTPSSRVRRWLSNRCRPPDKRPGLMSD
jgi:REP element-mobilizing transposase RayT